MTKRQQMALLLAAIVICLALGVYYLVPGIWHPLTFEGSPTDSHLKHALLFFGLALIGLIATRFVALGGTTRKP
jgi:hypothetical protein